MSDHKPHLTILFLATLVAAMYLTPWLEERCYADNKTEEVVETPVWSELLEEEEEIVGGGEDEVEQITHASDSFIVDHSRWVPDYATFNAENIPDSLKFQGNENARELLYRFFENLEMIDSADTAPLNVFHFGDSQIEGDRITGVLRASWQKSWGGSGPGLVPAVQPVPALALRQETSGDWSRYTRFGEIDSTLEHDCYGAMAAFCVAHGNGKIHLRPHPSGFRLNKKWDLAEIHIGAAPLGGDIIITGEHIETQVHHISPCTNGSHSVITAELSGKKEELEIEIEGYNVEITGIRLGAKNGIQIHNIPMRGSAGMIFKKLDKNHLKKYVESMDVGLLILQFGGNAVPYITDTIAAERYGRRFSSQLRYLRSLLPGVAIITIGPSDMGITKLGEEKTYPMLDVIRKSLREAVIGEDCLYWDLSEVIGGNGAMEAWSTSDPRLASSDLVHFTPKGARLVGEKLDLTIRAEYKSWATWRH